MTKVVNFLQCSIPELRDLPVLEVSCPTCPTPLWNSRIKPMDGNSLQSGEGFGESLQEMLSCFHYSGSTSNLDRKQELLKTFQCYSLNSAVSLIFKKSMRSSFR